MPPDSRCDEVQLELSIAHDQKHPPSADARSHVEGCDACTDFETRLGALDQLMATGEFGLAPDVASRVMEAVVRPPRQWRAVAAVAAVGLAVGAVVGGLGLDTGRAQDLNEMFHKTGANLDGLTADLLVVERGVHPEIPERIYAGSIEYVAPEKLSIELVDTTEYPNDEWLPNDVRLKIFDGDTLSVAGSPCPVAALPECLVPASTQALRDQPPFDDGVLIPLEIVGPGRSLTLSSAIDVVGTPALEGRPTIQVRSTVAAVELIGAIIGRGAWRDLYPTDSVLMWLDEETLVPIRIEVFATDSPERELWQLRRGYDDQIGEQPIFIIELSELTTEPGVIELIMPDDAPSIGFVEGEVDMPQPVLEPGFRLHRTGEWPLADGGVVTVASWSDGRSWLMVEATEDWDEPRLFGLSLPFVKPVDLGQGSVGYLAPTGNAVAIHLQGLDLVVSGSVPRESLLEAAASLDVGGLPVPTDWAEASTVEIDELPSGTLVPDVDGWSMAGRVDDGGTTIHLAGGGARTVIVTQQPGTRLEPPIGPDFYTVDVRGTPGRYDASAATLEWVEGGQIVSMRSETVGIGELQNLANSMEPR
jgi:hypothetical protein